MRLLPPCCSRRRRGATRGTPEERWRRIFLELRALRHLQHVFWSAGERLRLVPDRLRGRLRLLD